MMDADSIADQAERQYKKTRQKMEREWVAALKAGAEAIEAVAYIPVEPLKPRDPFKRQRALEDAHSKWVDTLIANSEVDPDDPLLPTLGIIPFSAGFQAGINYARQKKDQ